jgi:hypothetical protein
MDDSVYFFETGAFTKNKSDRKYTACLLDWSMKNSSTLKVSKCSLGDEGLMIQYFHDDKLSVLRCNALSACSILEEEGIIQGVETKYRKPVTVTLNFNGKNKKKPWGDFLRTFEFTLEMAASIVGKYGSSAKVNSNEISIAKK